jgi:hypothetical protein
MMPGRSSSTSTVPVTSRARPPPRATAAARTPRGRRITSTLPSRSARLNTDHRVALLRAALLERRDPCRRASPGPGAARRLEARARVRHEARGSAGPRPEGVPRQVEAERLLLVPREGARAATPRRRRAPPPRPRPRPRRRALPGRSRDRCAPSAPRSIARRRRRRGRRGTAEAVERPALMRRLVRPAC